MNNANDIIKTDNEKPIRKALIDGDGNVSLVEEFPGVKVTLSGVVDEQVLDLDDKEWRDAHKKLKNNTVSYNKSNGKLEFSKKDKVK